MTTEPRGMQSQELDLEGDSYIPCLGEYTHHFGPLTGPMLLLRNDYRLTFNASGELVVIRKIPLIADLARCAGTGR